MMGLPMVKEREKVRLLLHKQDIPSDFKINVKLFADVSSSFRPEFTYKHPDGSYLVDPFFVSALALAAEIDPDQQIQIIGFSDRGLDTGDYSIHFEGDIRAEFLQRASSILWGSTNYGSALDALLNSKNMLQQATGFFNRLFGKPVFAEKKEAYLTLFISDGEDMGSQAHFIRQLEKLAQMGTFTVLIGATYDSRERFNCMREAAATVEGCTFHRLSDLKTLSTDALYQRIFDTEFKRWYQQLPATYKN